MSCSIARSVREIKADLGSFVSADQIVRLCQAWFEQGGGRSTPGRESHRSRFIFL